MRRYGDGDEDKVCGDGVGMGTRTVGMGGIGTVLGGRSWDGDEFPVHLTYSADDSYARGVIMMSVLNQSVRFFKNCLH